MSNTTNYIIRVFIGGQPGYYEYTVGDTKDQALEHFSNIVRDGYRRVNDRGQMVHFMPRLIDKIVLAGPSLSIHYPDKIVTT